MHDMNFRLVQMYKRFKKCKDENKHGELHVLLFQSFISVANKYMYKICFNKAEEFSLQNTMQFLKILFQLYKLK